MTVSVHTKEYVEQIEKRQSKRASRTRRFLVRLFSIKKKTKKPHSFQRLVKALQETTNKPSTFHISRKLLARVDDAARDVPILQPHRTTCTRHPTNVQAVPEKEHVRTF